MKYAQWLYGLVLVCVFCSLRTAASAQDSVPVEFVGRVLPAYIENGDTIPYEHIFEVVIVPRRTFRNERELRAYRRMIANLKKVYPYAQEAKRLLREMDSVYGGLDSRAAKARYASQMERKLNRQFEKQIRNLTYSQGHQAHQPRDGAHDVRYYQAVSRRSLGRFLADYRQDVRVRPQVGLRPRGGGSDSE